MKWINQKRISLLLAVLMAVGQLAACKSPTEKEVKIEDAYRNYYEIFVGSFYDSDNDGCGDLNGVTEKLDYIEDLGFDGIWLTPIMPSPSYHKYDVTDYCAVEPSFGTIKDYENLVKECHRRGIRVILDMVFNHTSDKHPWFTEACSYLEGLKEGEEPDTSVCPYAGFYHFKQDAKAEANWYQAGNSSWYYEGVFWSGMPDLALENGAVRAELEKIADFWLEKGTDGFRLDAAKEYFTGYAEKNTEVLSWFTQHVKEKNPDAYLVAEVWEGQSALQEYYKSGIDSLFNFPAAQQDGALVKTAKGRVEPAEFFDWIIRNRSKNQASNPSYIDAPFLSNHDTTRISAQCVNDEEVMKFAAGLLFMMPGSPFVYYGEEIGMKSMGTKDENKRLPMYWSAQETKGMTKPPAEADAVEQKFAPADEQQKDPDSIYNYYKAALAIRNRCPELARGEISAVSGNFPKNTAGVARKWKGQESVVICSTADGISEISLQECGLADSKLKESLTADGSKVTLENGILKLPKYGIAILDRETADSADNSDKVAVDNAGNADNPDKAAADNESEAESAAGDSLSWEAAAATPYGKYPEPVVYTLGKMNGENNSNMPEGDTYENNVYTRYLKDTLNIQNEDVFEENEEQYVTNVEMAIASKQLPDVMVVNDRGTLLKLAEKDLIADLTEAYENCASDGIKAMYDSYEMSAVDTAVISGRLMALPEPNFVDGPNLLWLRKDWMDKLGLSEPETVAELENIVRAFVTKDPGNNGAGNTVGLVCHADLTGENGYNYEFQLDPIFSSFYAYPKQWVLDSKGNVTYGSIQPEAKEALIYLNRLYEEGVLDNSFMLRSMSNIAELIIDGKCGSFFGPWWAPNNPLMEAREKNPEAEWEPYLIATTKDGKIRYLDQKPSYKYVVVRKGYEHPELVFKMASVMFDRMRYEDKKNPELEAYFQKNVDSTARPIAINIDYSNALYQCYEQVNGALSGKIQPENLQILEHSYYEKCRAYLDDPEGSDAEAWAAYESRIKACALMDREKLEIVSPVFSGETETMAREWQKLLELEKNAYLEIICGEKEPDDFEAFVEEWKIQGGEKILEEVQKGL